jgi:uncharacterized membrane protein YcaP (DUF421 family)
MMAMLLDSIYTFDARRSTMHILLEVTIRSIIAFVLVMVIARIMGKRTISQLTYYDFVASITLGAIVGNIAFNTFLKAWQIIASLVVFSGIAFIVAIISLKSRNMRKWLSGRPTIVIENGKILEENMRKLTFSMDTLNQELREKDIFDIEEVEYAVIELNGKLSVLKKPEYRQITRKDLSMLHGAKSQFPVELIMDGEVVLNSIHQSDLSLEWLQSQLRQRGLTVEQVFYAVRGTNGTIHFDLYKDQINHPIKTE